MAKMGAGAGRMTSQVSLLEEKNGRQGEREGVGHRIAQAPGYRQHRMVANANGTIAQAVAHDVTEHKPVEPPR